MNDHLLKAPQQRIQGIALGYSKESCSEDCKVISGIRDGRGCVRAGPDQRNQPDNAGSELWTPAFEHADRFPRHGPDAQREWPSRRTKQSRRYGSESRIWRAAETYDIRQ